MCRSVETDREIGLPSRQRERAGQRDELDHQVRVSRRQQAELARQEQVAQTVRHADANGPARLGFRRAEPCRSRQDLRLDPLGRGDQLLAGIGQRRTVGSPVKQRGAERTLQGLDAARHGRVIEAELAARLQHLALPGDCEEDLQVVPVHGHYFAHIGLA